MQRILRLNAGCALQPENTESRTLVNNDVPVSETNNCHTGAC